MDPVSQFFPEINRFFDHVYVITLQRAAERHEHISRELAGLEYELFFGHDKNHFSIEELKLRRIYDEQLAIAHHRFGKPLVPGMIGCSWSHREVYEDIIRKNYRNALVLEDDVVIDRKHMHLVHEILSEVPPDWELLYLGFARNEKKPVLSTLKKLIYHIQRLLRNHKFSHRTIRNMYPRKVSAHIMRAGYHDQTHAYAVTRAGAEKLAELQQPISFIADNLLAHAITNDIVRGYACTPKLINQQSQGEHNNGTTYIGD